MASRRRGNPSTPQYFACRFCDSVFVSRGKLNTHLDKLIPAYRRQFGHPPCTADRLHHIGIIQAHRMTARRPGVDIAEPNQSLHLVLSEFSRYTEYSTPEKKLPPRTSLCEVDATWWQSGVDDVLAEFERNRDREALRQAVRTLVEVSESFLARDVRAGNMLSVNTSGLVARDVVLKAAGDILFSGRKIDKSQHDHGATSFAGNMQNSGAGKRKEKETAPLRTEMDEDHEYGYYHDDADQDGYYQRHAVDDDNDDDDDDDHDEDDAEDDLPPVNKRGYVPAGDNRLANAQHVDLSNIDSSSSSDIEPLRPTRRHRSDQVSLQNTRRPIPSKPAVALPPVERTVSKIRAPLPPPPRPSKIDITSFDHLFTLEVSILRRPAVSILVYGYETLAMIISTAWEQAPKSIRGNEDPKVMLSEDEKKWHGIWNESMWKDIVKAAGKEIKPAVYQVVLEFEE